MLDEAGSINSRDIPDHWPVELEACVQIAAGTTSNFTLHAEITLDERIAAEVQISAAAQTLGEIGEGIRVVGRGAGEGAHSKSRIHLLRLNSDHQGEGGHHHHIK